MVIKMFYDKIIIGAGFYGLYAAKYCGNKGEKVLVLEKDSEAFMRATYINQARVHMGYHYPRSISTAKKSADYFDRFCNDFGFCIYDSFKQVYATSSNFSWTNAAAFEKFCKSTNIVCEKLSPDTFFKKGMCDGAFLTKEYTYDAQILKDSLLNDLSKISNVTIMYNHKPEKISQNGENYIVESKEIIAETSYILNATYAGVNDIHNLVGFPPFKIKYEKCEIILCKADEKLKDIGITVMDGPFFSIMPFGKTGYHSLTSVTFTPHETSYSDLAEFECQKSSDCLCKKGDLYNCNICPAKPQSAWPFMEKLAKKYLLDKYGFEYVGSLYSMKPILQSTEVDDSRPTVIKVMSEKPKFVSVLSGKINTVYDLDEVLYYDK